MPLDDAVVTLDLLGQLGLEKVFLHFFIRDGIFRQTVGKLEDILLKTSLLLQLGGRREWTQTNFEMAKMHGGELNVNIDPLIKIQKN